MPAHAYCDTCHSLFKEHVDAKYTITVDGSIIYYFCQRHLLVKLLDFVLYSTSIGTLHFTVKEIK